LKGDVNSCASPVIGDVKEKQGRKVNSDKRSDAIKRRNGGRDWYSCCRSWRFLKERELLEVLGKSGQLGTRSLKRQVNWGRGAWLTVPVGVLKEKDAGMLLFGERENPGERRNFEDTFPRVQKNWGFVTSKKKERKQREDRIDKRWRWSLKKGGSRTEKELKKDKGRERCG